MTETPRKINDAEFEYWKLCDLDDEVFDRHFAAIGANDWIDCHGELLRILNLPGFADMEIEENSIIDEILNAALFAAFAAGVHKTARFLEIEDSDDLLSEVIL